MAEEQTGVMPTAQAQQPDSAEMVQISKEELEKIRKGLKEANAEAAKYRIAQEKLDTERKAKETAEMTELEKIKARAQELETKLAQKERASLQSEVAARLGLPAKLAGRLQGATPEELEADAKAILDDLPKQPPPANGQQRANPGATNPANAQPASGETDKEKRRRLGLSR
jgi:phage terminase Nu1 subunit (DNA packaging protein)